MPFLYRLQLGLGQRFGVVGHVVTSNNGCIVAFTKADALAVSTFPLAIGLTSKTIALGLACARVFRMIASNDLVRPRLSTTPSSAA